MPEFIIEFLATILRIVSNHNETFVIDEIESNAEEVEEA